MSENKNEPKIAEQPKKAEPGEGIRSMKSTTAFRAINFELYAKPSKYAISFLQFKNKFIYVMAFRYCGDGHWINLHNKCVRIHSLHEIYL